MEVVADGIGFGEGPRWHQGRLWFSDIGSGLVMSLQIGEARPTEVAPVMGNPSGLGWDPDGRLMVVSMSERRLLKETASLSGVLRPFADLSEWEPFASNDMLVDAVGRAYVGGFGFDLIGRGAKAPARLVRVESDGSVAVAAEDLYFPNGIVQIDDGRTLVVAETLGRRLTAFDIEDGGSLTNRRPWASLPEGCLPDGICADDEDCIWVASPVTYEILRVAPGHGVIQRVKSNRRPMACTLGGDDGRLLLACTSLSGDPSRDGPERVGRIEATTVDVRAQTPPEGIRT